MIALSHRSVCRALQTICPRALGLVRSLSRIQMAGGGGYQIQSTRGQSYWVGEQMTTVSMV